MPGGRVMKWNEDFKKVPDDTNPFLVKVNHGIFSGGWQFHKALNIRGMIFNYETKELIKDPHSWAKVTL